MPQALPKVSTMRCSIYQGYQGRKKLSRAVSKSYSFEKSMRKVFRWSLFFSFVLLGIFIYNLYLNLQLVDINFSLKNTKDKSQDIEIQVQNLESKLIGMTSIGNLKRLANSLKLVEAKEIKFVKISIPGSLSFEK